MGIHIRVRWAAAYAEHRAKVKTEVATTNTTPHNRTPPRDRTTTQKRRFFARFRQQCIILVISQIGGREVNLRTILRLFPIHHFVVSSIAKYLIGVFWILPRETAAVWRGRVTQTFPLLQTYHHVW